MIAPSSSRRRPARTSTALPGPSPGWRRLGASWALAAAAFLATPALAQPQPTIGPSSSHIFPAGGRRGTIVSVAVGGECLPPGTKFSLLGEKLEVLQPILKQRVADAGEPSPRRNPTEIPITYPKQWASQISIADDAALGPAYWRLSCGQGGTCSRPFLVGDLPEFIETESNSLLQQAETINLPVTVNGQISGERDVDYYRFSATAAEIVSCEVVARRIGSPLDANLAVLDGAGHELAVEQRYVGSDILLAAAIPETGEYFLRISNVSFRGDSSCVYRLNISTKPFIFSCSPLGGAAGSARNIAFLAMSGTNRPIEREQTVLFPDGNDERFVYDCPWSANAVTLDVDAGASLRESEPNQSFAAATVVPVPTTVDGCFHSARDVDWFTFEAAKGERLSLVCRSHSFLSSALPTLAVFDSGGNELVNSTAPILGEDRRLEWQAPESGSYGLRLRDLRFGSQGGPEFVYRLSVRRAAPDFTLQLAQDCVNLVAGGKVEIPVTVQRAGGFDGDVTLTVEGLPEGITAEATTAAAKQNETRLTLKASTGVPLGDVPLTIAGRAEIAGDQVARVATARHQGVDEEGVSIGDPTLDRVTLTVACKPAFRLFCAEAYQYAHRGSVFLYPMEIERLNGFTGAVTLQIGDRQNRDLDGIEMFEVTIPPGQTATNLPIYLPETMHINIQSQSQLYAQGYAQFNDELGAGHCVLVLAEKRNMLRTLPPVVKLRAAQQHVTLAAGGEVAIRLQLERTKNFAGPMTVQLLTPASSAITAEPIQIPAGETEREMVIRVGSDWQPVDGASFRFRATGMMDDSIQLITEATVELN